MRSVWPAAPSGTTTICSCCSTAAARRASTADTRATLRPPAGAAAAAEGAATMPAASNCSDSVREAGRTAAHREAGGREGKQVPGASQQRMTQRNR